MNHRTHLPEAFTIAGGGTLIVAPMAAKDVVTVEGSVLGGPNYFSDRQTMIPKVAVELLDAGTAKKKKDAFRTALADRNISLSFESAADRTYFSAQCLPEDLPFLASSIVECLTEASFPETEVRAQKTRSLSSLHESKTDTLVQAKIALSRLLYDPKHVNFSPTLEEKTKAIRAITRRNLTEFEHTLGRGGLTVVVTGDIDERDARAAFEKASKKLKKGSTDVPLKTDNKKAPSAKEETIPIPDKANIDVLLGAAVPLHRRDPLYVPLVVVTDMLGGGFASHLMQTVRERDGLTYGVRAGLGGFEAGTDGWFQVWATFSPDLYGKSAEILKREVQTFFTSGMTEEALAKKKEETLGSFLINRSTTTGLARALHQNAINGRDLSYFAQYPDLIRALTLQDIQQAAHLIPIENLSFVAAGTFPKK